MRSGRTVRQYHQSASPPRDHGNPKSGRRPTGASMRLRLPPAAGGTFAGVSEYLKSRRRTIRTVLVDPPGSSLFEYVRNGTLKSTGSGRSPKASVSADHANLKMRRSMTPFTSRMRTPFGLSIACCARKDSSWAARAASMWPQPCVLHWNWVAEHTIVTVTVRWRCKIPVAAVQSRVARTEKPGAARR